MFGKSSVSNFRKLMLFSLVFSVFFISIPVHAAVKDTDADGLTDDAEVSTYKTDVTKFDTDGDGFSDGLEVLKKTDPLNSQISPAQTLLGKNYDLIAREDPLQWYISRISGITAYILLSFVVMFGMVQTTKMLIKFRFMFPATAQEVHRFLAWSGMAMVLLHVLMLFFDSYFKVNITEVLIPFTLKRDFLSTLGWDFTITVAMGIIGLYLILILISTSELKNRIVSVKFWRTVHYASFLGYLLFTAHGFLSGTDSNEPWMRAIYISSLTATTLLLLGRIFRKKLFFPKRKERITNDQTIPRPQTI